MDWTNAQRKLGVTADGKPGPKTISALLTYTFGHPVPAGIADGIVANLTTLSTPARLADFIGQTGHETGGYRVFSENLNYSANSALKTFPSHFNAALAQWADRNPERIAEVAYGIKSRQGHGRMGNTQPGDGYKYRGRGVLQITGKDNYKFYGKLVGLDLVASPDLAADPKISIAIAIAYYNQNHIWNLIDANNPLQARKAVNGGTNGYAQVNDIRAKVLSLFK